MRRSRWWPRLLAGSLAAGCLCLAVRPGEAVEEARKFLDRLRDPDGEFRYYDTALEYLEMMRTSPLVGKDFRDVIDYEAGVTLIDASRIGGPMAEREQQLGQARERFQKFLSEHPTHPLVAGANTQLANLLVERGRIKVEQAANTNKTPEEKKQLTGEARKQYQEAQKRFAKLEERFLEEHRKFPKFIDPKKTQQIAARDRVRRDLLQARLALATVVYEISKTYAAGGKENKDALNEAANKYNEMYTKYPTRMAGLYGHMWEGRCYKELGEYEKAEDQKAAEYQKAFEAFEDLLLEEDQSPAFRKLKNKTLILFLETCLLVKGKKYEEAIAGFLEWKKFARPDEENDRNGLAIHYLTGEVVFEYAKTLKKKEQKKQQKQLLQDAKELFDFVARFPGDYRQKAHQAAMRPEIVGPDFVRQEPKDFVEAYDRAKVALGRTQREDLRADEIATARTEATKYFRMALRIRSEQVAIEEINAIRYYLAYLYYMSGDLYEAAVMGEFLARQYPNAMGGRKGAEIAMAAYAKLYNDAYQARLKELEEARPGEDHRAEVLSLLKFEIDQMDGIAEHITRRWAGKPEADKAWMMLIRNALSKDELDKAREHLKNVPLESGYRGEIEVMVGQRLWAEYLKKLRQHVSAKNQHLKMTRLPEDQRPDQTELDKMQAELDKVQAELDKMVGEAQKTLDDGIKRMRKAVAEGGEVSYTLVASVLSLAQINIGAGEAEKAEKAVELLEDEKIGAWALVAKNDPVTDRGNFRAETCKAALRAYVATRQLDNAKEAMKLLEELVQEGGDAQAGEKLTRIYISLGLQLKERLEGLRAKNETQKAEEVSDAFELFLDGIRKRKEGNSFPSLTWVGNTFFTLGESFDRDGKPDEAKNCYTKAAETYQTILELCNDEAFGAPQGAPTAIKIRLARCLRHMGEYQEALDKLLEILKVRSMMIDAQIEAAYTYQAWGTEEPRSYYLAYSGSDQHKEIWGWGTIARRVMPKEEFRSVFHEARYNFAFCRFKRGMSKKTEKQREAFLEQAEKDILRVQGLYPKMGKDYGWYQKYDDLLKNVRRSLGRKNPPGLEATGPTE